MNRTLKYHVHESLPSTQEVAKTLHLEPQKLHVIASYEQTEGKGTFGKQWISPKGSGLYVTYAFQLGQTGFISSLSHLAACAVCLACQDINPKIKWPNDILVKQQKLAGVLSEVSDHNVFVGIGINLRINDSQKNLIDQPVTSYSEHKNPPDFEDLLEKLSFEFLKLLQLWEQSGFPSIKETYKRFFQFMHQEVIIDTPQGLLKGVVINFSDDGYPILQIGSQEIIVSHLKHINQG